MITEIMIKTTDNSLHYIKRVESYSYDRDFIRVHSISEINEKVVDLFPTDKIVSLRITKWGENNA